MSPFKFMPLFCIIFMVSGLPLLPSYNAYATCCAPCKCYAYCWCAGINNCPKYQCHTDDSASLQVQAMNSNEGLDVSGSYASSPAPAIKSHSIDRLITVASSGQCARNNYTLKFFQSAEDRLKFEPDFLKYNAGEDNDIVASQVSLAEER